MFCYNSLNLLTLGVILKLLTIANCLNLFELPIKSPKSNVHIEATITDKTDGNARWSISEDLAGLPKPHGKVHVTKGAQSFEVFYHQSFGDGHLIVSDNDCSQIGSDPDDWLTMTPEGDKPLLNLLLLTGPSIIYRLSDSSLKWDEFDVDGAKTQYKNTTLDGTLRIKAHFNDDRTSDIERAVRFDFDGYYKVPGMSFESKIEENLVLNIVSLETVTEDLSIKVHPPTGIGCPIYFQPNLEFPKLTNRQLHFTATQTTTSYLMKTKAISGVEVYIDSDIKLTRIGVGNDYSINDFNLGVSYVFNDTECVIKPFSKSIVGLVYGNLDVNEITWMNGPFKYVGKTIYEPRARGIFDTWESTEYNRIIDEVKYDKIVTTQYMARVSVSNGPASVDYVPVAMVRVTYKKDPTNEKYFIAEVKRRDISEFQRAITKTQYQSLFSISECFNHNERITLTFDIRSLEYGSTCNTDIQYAEENVNRFKENFRNELAKQISPLRIASISLDFGIDRISAKVEFLARPSLEKSFQSIDTRVKVGVKSLTNFGAVSAKSINECLKDQIEEYSDKILYCPSSNGLCMKIDDPNFLFSNENEFIDCTLYSFPLINVKRLSSEIELHNLHKSLLLYADMLVMMITLECENCPTPKKYRYRVINILDYTFLHQKVAKRPFFTEVQRSSKLDASATQVQLVTGSIHSFSDCYRTCISPNNSECLAFSFCSDGDNSECLTSSVLFNPNVTLPSSTHNCTTYGRDFLSEYLKGPLRQFSDSLVEVSFASWSADDCAAKCSQSANCLAFQYCSNKQCTFTGSSNSIKKVKKDAACDVYTRKKSQEFMVTGSTLVLEYILNESKLDMEQCAALCYNWKAGNESCRSFNFCSKGRLESTCQLTQYTVGDPNVQTSPSQNCFNFELLNPHPPPARVHSIFLPKDEGISSATTSISLAFLIIGLALGVAATSIYHAVHNRHKYRVTNSDQDLDT